MIVCNRCREPNPDDAVHCVSCRAYLAWSRANEPPAQPGPAQHGPAQHGPSPYGPAAGRQGPSTAAGGGQPAGGRPDPNAGQYPGGGQYGSHPDQPGTPGAGPYPGGSAPRWPGDTAAGQYPSSPYGTPAGGGQPGGPPVNPYGPGAGRPDPGRPDPGRPDPGRPDHGAGRYPSSPYGIPPGGGQPGGPPVNPYGPDPSRPDPGRPDLGAGQYPSTPSGGGVPPAYGVPADGRQPGGQPAAPYGPPAGGRPGPNTGQYPSSPYGTPAAGQQGHGAGQLPQAPPGPSITPPGVRRNVNTVQLGRVAPVDPLAPRVPERTIGVTISDQQTRVAPRPGAAPPPSPHDYAEAGDQQGSGFDAVQPQELQDRPYHPQPTATPRTTGVSGGPPPLMADGRMPEFGEIRCPTCGTALPEGRRFCRCGTSLVKSKVASNAAVTSARLPWYRRIGDFVGSGRDFRRSMRGANRGLRATYNAGLSARTHMVRGMILMGTMGIGVSQFGPWGGDLRGQVSDQVQRFLPKSFIEVPVESVATDPVVKALPGYDVKFAADGNPGRAWAAAWVPVAANGQPCNRAGGAPALVITFRQPDAIRRVTVQAGLADGNDQRTQQARPRELDLLFSDGTCTVFDLTDSAAAQTVNVRVNGATSVRATIVDAYDAQDATGRPLIAISEISFQRQK
jgi:hypothetical protein